MSKYPLDILIDVRKSLRIETDDTSKDNEINKMSKFEVLARVLVINGLYGLDYTLQSWLIDIYGFDIIDKDFNSYQLLGNKKVKINKRKEVK